jgi:hypothetical protein
MISLDIFTRSLAIVVLICLISSSGCLNNTKDNVIITADPLPDGYKYIATLPDSEYNNSQNVIRSSEEAYRDRDNFDLSLNIIELDSQNSAVEFISGYRTTFEELKTEDRFTQIYFNGHEAIQIKKYTIINGTQLPRYQIIWNNDNVVYIIKSNSNLEDSAMELAKATGC